jgi:hypothetical protein
MHLRKYFMKKSVGIQKIVTHTFSMSSGSNDMTIGSLPKRPGK